MEAEQIAWREYRQALHRFVARRVDDPAAAEDIVHDVIVRALENQHALRDPGSVRQWLYRITRNAVTDHYRARRPHEPLPDDLAADNGPAAGARGELARCLTPFINDLPDGYREAVLLSEIDGLTQQETADRLGISLSGAKSRVQRARRMLRDRVLACCRVELDARGAISDYDPRRDCGCSAARACDCGGSPRLVPLR